MSKIVLVGNGPFACIGFDVLREIGVVPALVFADHHDDGVDTWQPSFVRHLSARKVKYHQFRSLSDEAVCSMVEQCDPDFIFVFQGRAILRNPLIKLARKGVVNLHNAPLPLLRGCDPFAWAIEDGLAEMGVSLHLIEDEGIDTGAILCQRYWPIGARDTCWSLYQRALIEARELMLFGIPQILANAMTPAKQDARYATYHPIGQFDFASQRINWQMPAAALSAWIRSRIFPPRQLPYFVHEGRCVEIVDCEYVKAKGGSGAVVQVDPFDVASRYGGIRIHAARINGNNEAGPAVASELGLQTGSVIKE
jgi:methionyl-tRNA formyltransferase